MSLLLLVSVAWPAPGCTGPLALQEAELNEGRLTFEVHDQGAREQRSPLARCLVRVRVHADPDHPDRVVEVWDGRGQFDVGLARPLEVGVVTGDGGTPSCLHIGLGDQTVNTWGTCGGQLDIGPVELFGWRASNERLDVEVQQERNLPNVPGDIIRSILPYAPTPEWGWTVNVYDDDALENIVASHRGVGRTARLTIPERRPLYLVVMRSDAIKGEVVRIDESYDDNATERLKRHQWSLLMPMATAIAACWLPGLWFAFLAGAVPPKRRRPTLAERRRERLLGSVFAESPEEHSATTYHGSSCQLCSQNDPELPDLRADVA